MRFSIVGLVSVALLGRALLAQPIGSEFRVNSYTTSDQRWSSVASDPLGDFVVLWYSAAEDGSSNGIFGQRYASSGAPSGAEFRVNTYTSGSQYRPSVAMDDAGRFVVVWWSDTQDGSGFGVFGQRFASGGAPLGPEFRVSSTTSDAQIFPVVAANAAGDFVVAWQGYAQDGSSFGVFAQRYASSGSPLGPEFQVNTTTSSYQRFASVSLAPSGDFVVAWESYGDGNLLGVFAQRYASDGSTRGGEFRVNSYTTGHQEFTAVKVADDGSFLVAWSGGSGFVSGQRYASGGDPLGTEFQISSYTTANKKHKRIAVDRAGTFVITWAVDQQDGASFGVFARRYASDGSARGGEFRVNTSTTGSEEYPAISASGVDGFVVTWSVFDPVDGSSTAIFAQRYCAPLSAVTVSLSGTNTLCTTTDGGTATVADSGGGGSSHQWVYRTSATGPFPILGATGRSYAVHGPDFGGAGVFYLSCFTTPQCGSPTPASNEILLFVAADVAGPTVSAPAGATAIQTLCQ